METEAGRSGGVQVPGGKGDMEGQLDISGPTESVEIVTCVAARIPRG